MLDGVRIMMEIDERERIILAMRWGIEPYEKLTYRSIGMIFGICGERVRQLEYRAIRKLRMEGIKRNINKVHLIINTLGE